MQATRTKSDTFHLKHLGSYVLQMLWETPVIVTFLKLLACHSIIISHKSTFAHLNEVLEPPQYHRSSGQRYTLSVM